MTRPRGKESGDPLKTGRRAGVESEPSGPRNAIPDLMRKALTLGLSGFFVTEEVFRKALGDTLPRDWIEFMLEQSARTRAEFVERLGAEVGQALENTDLAQVLEQLLEGRSVEIVAQVRLQPKAGGTPETPKARRPSKKRRCD
jgi:hypothetical protein